MGLSVSPSGSGLTRVGSILLQTTPIPDLSVAGDTVILASTALPRTGIVTNVVLRNFSAPAGDGDFDISSHSDQWSEKPVGFNRYEASTINFLSLSTRGDAQGMKPNPTRVQSGNNLTFSLTTPPGGGGSCVIDVYGYYIDDATLLPIPNLP